MENESNISLGGTIILFALFVQNYFWVKNALITGDQVDSTQQINNKHEY